MSRFIGFDCPTLNCPDEGIAATILATFARRIITTLAAEQRYSAYVAHLSEAELADPTEEVADRLERLEDRFAQADRAKLESQRAAIGIIRSAGADTNRGAVRSGGKLFAIVRDDETDLTSERVIVIDLGEVRDV
jgi:hypothetical protein